MPQRRSTRPLAWGLRAWMERIPSSASTRPTWVGRGPPASSSSSVRGSCFWRRKMPWRSTYRAWGRPFVRATSRSQSRYPWASSCWRNRAEGTVPVASSIPPTRVSQGPSGPSQRWRLPSAWSSSPSRAARSRRRRCLGARRERGLPSPAPRSTRRTVVRPTRSRSTSASSSVRCWWLKPAYFACARATICSRTAAGSRFAGARPRLPCTRAAGPPAREAATRRRTWRTDSPSASAACAGVQSPATTRVSTSARRCSRVPNVICSSCMPPGGQIRWPPREDIIAGHQHEAHRRA